MIVTKAGPGTISEALICGLPMVLNAFVPCQEEGNIPYVTDNKVCRACGEHMGGRTEALGKGEGGQEVAALQGAALCALEHAPSGMPAPPPSP